MIHKGNPTCEYKRDHKKAQEKEIQQHGINKL